VKPGPKKGGGAMAGGEFPPGVQFRTPVDAGIAGAFGVWQVAKNIKVGNGLHIGADETELDENRLEGEPTKGVEEKAERTKRRAEKTRVKVEGSGKGVAIANGERVEFGTCKGVVVPAIHWRVDASAGGKGGGEKRRGGGR